MCIRDSIGDATRQNVTENSEAGAQHGLGLKLPGDRCSRLKDRQGRRGKHVTETGLNGGVQRLIYVMRYGSERPAKTSDLPMRIEWVGIERVSNSKSPSELLGHFPSVLRIHIEIQEVKGFVCKRRESFCCRGCDSLNVLLQGGVGYGGDRALTEVIICLLYTSRCV